MSNQDNTPKELTVKVNEMSGAIGSLKAEADRLVVKTPEQAEEAARLLTTANSYKKRGEELRLFFTKPLNDQLKRINDLFRPAKTSVEEIEGIVTSKIRTYREAEAEKVRVAQEKEREKQRIAFEKEQERRRKEAEKEAEKERKRLEKEELSKKERKAEEARIAEVEKARLAELNKAEFVPQEPTIQQEKKIGNLGTRKVWDFEITNENDVPRQYLKVDETAIRNAIKAGERNIAGVKIYQREDYTKRA